MLTRNSFHNALLADVFPDGLTRADSMLLFALLHTHQVNVVDSVLADAPHIKYFTALTQRHCAECLAHMHRADDALADYAHWYWAWNSGWSYERIDRLSGTELDRFTQLKDMIEGHPAVMSMTPEDA